MLWDALDHYNQQKDEVDQHDTLPAAAAKLTLTKRSDKADELLTAFDVASSSTPTPMSSTSQIQDHGDDHDDDHVHDQDGESPKDWHYDEDEDLGFFGNAYDAYGDIESEDDEDDHVPEDWQHENDEGEDQGEDHEELPKDWHYDVDNVYDAYEDSETEDDENGGVSPETITSTEAGDTTPQISEVAIFILRLINFSSLFLFQEYESEVDDEEDQEDTPKISEVTTGSIRNDCHVFERL